MASPSVGCPCCAFRILPDLFLPSKDRNDPDESSAEELSPVQALTRLQASHARLVDTHSHAHLERGDALSKESESPYARSGEDSGDDYIVSCAVSPSDWSTCLEYAAQSTSRKAALGVHPWYIDQLLVDNHLNETWLKDLEVLVQQHPTCLIGEIGLCKHAKFLRTFPRGKPKAMELQRTVLNQQLKLAATYQRPVSIHCVDQHAVLLKLFQELSSSQQSNGLPPAIAMHSFTGTANHVEQLLQWERSLARGPSEPPLLYFGFSHTINSFGSDKSRRQNVRALQQVPRDRLLVESDVHRHDHVAAGTAGAIAYVTWALQQQVQDGGDIRECGNAGPISLEDVALLTARNAMRLLSCVTLVDYNKAVAKD